eukprot:jgi/Mesen1/10661/ME000009S10442
METGERRSGSSWHNQFSFLQRSFSPVLSGGREGQFPVGHALRSFTGRQPNSTGSSEGASVKRSVAVSVADAQTGAAPRVGQQGCWSGPAGDQQADHLSGTESHLNSVQRTEIALESFPKDLIAGGLLGGVAHSVVAPIERAKLVLQTQESNMQILQGHQRRYRGMVDAIRTISKEEGFWSLWRGNGSSVMRYYPSVALNFAFKDFYRVWFAPAPHAGGGEASLARRAAGNFAAGALAGSTSLLFTYPLDIAHTRLATDVGARRQFRGLRNFLATIYHKEGLKGLYRGFPASVHGIVVHRSVYFGGFDTAKQVLLGEDRGGEGDAAPQQGQQQGQQRRRAPFWQRWVLAQAATTTAGLVAYPLDTVRHRMMMQSGLDADARMYAGTLDCWRKIYANEGPRAFYKGCLSNMFRGTGAAMILVLYDEIKQWTHHIVPDTHKGL